MNQTQTQTQTIKAYLKKTKEVAAVKRALSVMLLNSGADVSLTGYTVKHAQRLRRNFLKIGVTVFDDKRLNNRERILTKAQRDEVLFILKNKTPKDVVANCNEQYWNTYQLGEYIHTLTGKRYKSKTSNYLLFREAKLTFHCPGKSYEKTDPAKTTTWESRQRDRRSALHKAWKSPDTIILCEDEMVLTSRTTIQKVWLPQGQYPPTIDTNGTRQRRSVYGFLNLKTGSQHAFMTEWQNMYITVTVLKQIRDIYPTQKLFLIWDNCGWHRGSEVTKWIKNDKNTTVLWFPPYSPKLNPQEHVWKEGRRATTHNQHVTDIVATTKDFISNISKRQFKYELCGLRAT